MEFAVGVERNCPIIVSKLSFDELRSALFLFMDFYEHDKSLITRSQEYNEIIHFPDKLKDAVVRICMNTPPLLSELLLTMRNYELAKQLGSCKHKMQNCNNIDQFWKSLYLICEEIEDSELEKLKKFFPEADDAICMEHLICILFCNKTIFENDITKLVSALQKINKSELCIKIKKRAVLNKVDDYIIPTPNQKSPCGIAIIINENKFQDCHELTLKERNGSHFDRDGLKDLWQHFGLEVFVYEDQTAQEIFSIFTKFVENVPLYCHVFVACFLSHGNKDVIYSYDAKALKIEYFISLVANHCPFLNNKPKVFIIQACQGQKQQHGATAHVTTSCKFPTSFETDAIRIDDAPEYGDVYQAVATIPGYVSYRCPNNGSLFITEFTKLMKEFGHIEDIEMTMRRVNNAVCERNQMPLTLSTLRKRLIFKLAVSC